MNLYKSVEAATGKKCLRETEEIALRAVIAWLLEHKATKPDEAHGVWVKEMVRQGVQYGFSRTRTVDSRLCPYDQLQEQDKEVYHTIINVLRCNF
jgi:hypothetical protein